VTSAAERLVEASQPRANDYPGDPVAYLRLSVPKRDLERVPDVDPAIYYGLVGRIAKTIAPHTEADPVGLIAVLLAASGAIVGPGPHVRVGGTQHGCRVWPLLVGATGAGRKDTVTAEVRSFIRSFVDPEFEQNHLACGLSTGEGLIARVRDPEPRDDDGTDKRPKPHPGVEDKRLLVVESEFGRVLGVSKKDGNTISAVLRQAWDGDRMSVLTRGDPMSATGAHITVVGHVTPRELQLTLGEKDIAGGLANRFMTIIVHRSQHLPSSDTYPHEALDDLGNQLRGNLDVGRALGPVRRDAEAELLWCKSLYAELSPDDLDDGAAAEVIARGSAQVLRLALTYAVANGESEITRGSLLAARAFWRYVVESAGRLFGDASGITDLDRLRHFIQQKHEGRTRTEINHLFNKNLSKERIDGLVSHLVKAGQAEMVTDGSVTAGRPAQRVRWIAL